MIVQQLGSRRHGLASRPATYRARMPREPSLSGVLFAELAAATEDVRAVPGRLAKVERIAVALRGLAPGERVAGASYLAGSPRQRVLGVGWASLREDPPPAAAEPALT